METFHNYHPGSNNLQQLNFLLSAVMVVISDCRYRRVGPQELRNCTAVTGATNQALNLADTTRDRVGWQE